jgi:phosphoribosylpyrophosphate synthetase
MDRLIEIIDVGDGGCTFVGIASGLRKLNPTKLRLLVTHAVNYDGILKVANVYDEVVITNSYKNWGANETLPNNVRVNDIISKL